MHISAWETEYEKKENKTKILHTNDCGEANTCFSGLERMNSSESDVHFLLEMMVLMGFDI